MKVFCSPTDDILGYRGYLSTKGFDDVELVPSIEQDFVTLVKYAVAPNVSEYTVQKTLEMYECFSGPGKDGGVYITEQVGFTDQALSKIKELNGSFFVPLTVGTVYKALPLGLSAETNFFGPVDCFVYSSDFAKKFVENVDFRQPFDVVAMALLNASPPYKFVPISERLDYNARPKDVYEGYWNGIVGQALLVTVMVVGGAILANIFGLVKFSAKLQGIIIVALFGLMLLYVMAFFFRLFGVKFSFIYDSSGLGIAFGVLLVALAALAVINDISAIFAAEKVGAPKVFEWYAAWGLMVSVIWLYGEILSLLARLAAAKDR